jgi:hypothetical protein
MYYAQTERIQAGLTLQSTCGTQNNDDFWETLNFTCKRICFVLYCNVNTQNKVGENNEV